MPTSPSTHDHQSDVPPAVHARIDAGFACARCGREDGPMRPADDSNTRFVHTDPCPGAVAPDDGPAPAFTMHPKGRPGAAGPAATSPVLQRLSRAVAAAESLGEKDVTVSPADLSVLLELHTDVLPTFGQAAKELTVALQADQVTFEDRLWQLRLAMTRVLQWRDLGRWLLEGWEDPPQDVVDASAGLKEAMRVHLRRGGDEDFAERVAGIWSAADRLEQAIARLLLDGGQ